MYRYSVDIHVYIYIYIRRHMSIAIGIADLGVTEGVVLSGPVISFAVGFWV